MQNRQGGIKNYEHIFNFPSVSSYGEDCRNVAKTSKRIELLEDCFAVEKDIKGGQRKTKDNSGALRDLSKIIKLCMGEKTMLKKQIEQMEKMAGDQGFISHNQKLARIMEENKNREAEFDLWLKSQIDRGDK